MSNMNNFHAHQTWPIGQQTKTAIMANMDNMANIDSKHSQHDQQTWPTRPANMAT